MKISFITTVKHNVGDDFIRVGLRYLLRQRFADESLQFSNIHKHSPITVRYGFEWFRSLKFSKRIDPLLPDLMRNRVSESDLLVLAGAPVFWCHQSTHNHCFNNEWYKPLITRRHTPARPTQKLVNLAAGTCQSYSSTGEEFCDACKAYMNELASLADVTTVRDSLSRLIYEGVGIDVPTIPCSSIFAADELNIQAASEAEYVVVNYMRGGAHYTFEQQIDFDKWQAEFSKFYFELKKTETVVFACHNQKEVDHALEIDSEANIFYQKDRYEKYIEFYSKAKYGIVNRVHAAFMLASFGKPCIAVGNDSRVRMVEQIGVRHFFVNDVDADLLAEQNKLLSSGDNNFAERFASLKQKAFSEYMDQLQSLA